jgi:hypothetical protein
MLPQLCAHYGQDWGGLFPFTSGKQHQNRAAFMNRVVSEQTCLERKVIHPWGDAISQVLGLTGSEDS